MRLRVCACVCVCVCVCSLCGVLDPGVLYYEYDRTVARRLSESLCVGCDCVRLVLLCARYPGVYGACARWR